MKTKENMKKLIFIIVMLLLQSTIYSFDNNFFYYYPYGWNLNDNENTSKLISDQVERITIQQGEYIRFNFEDYMITQKKYGYKLVLNGFEFYIHTSNIISNNYLFIDLFTFTPMIFFIPKNYEFEEDEFLLINNEKLTINSIERETYAISVYFQSKIVTPNGNVIWENLIRNNDILGEINNLVFKTEKEKMLPGEYVGYTEGNFEINFISTNDKVLLPILIRINE